MSLILEALRKSEAERRRGQAPDLHAELPPVPAQRRVAIPAWTWVLPASAILLAALWLVRAPRPSNAATAAATNAVISADPDVASTPALPKVPRLVPAPASTRPEPASASAVATEDPQPSAHAPSAAAATPAPLAASTHVVPPPPTIAPLPASNGTLQLSDLSADERKSLPPLKLSMHLWNDDPRQRLVILDGSRLREGDRVGNAVITAITSDGVLLDWNGQQLKLSIH